MGQIPLKYRFMMYNYFIFQTLKNLKIAKNNDEN